MDTRTAAICDARGHALAELQVPAATAGYAGLLARVSAAAGAARVAHVARAVEGTRHYGLGLARYLAAEGQLVTEIDGTKRGNRPPGTPS